MAYVRLLLLPFSMLYGIVIWIRNRCYDWGWIKSTAFDKPVIVVGNLAVGGTGKSPMTEYLVKFLGRHLRIATLSRGYGRKTQGFLEVLPGGTAEQYGDEPLQFKRKFPTTTISVDENRVRGVRQLFESGHDVVILDDAYQHRALRPGFAILLFDYRSLDAPRWLLPAGNYRDGFRERCRADVMVVTKTPVDATEKAKQQIRRLLATSKQIPIFFSSIAYGLPVPLLANRPAELILDGKVTVLLVTGIANPAPLYAYLKAQVEEVIQLRYPDHYAYTPKTAATIRARFDDIGNSSKVIITTEKDAQRLSAPKLSENLEGLPIYVIPIQAQFDRDDEKVFQQLVWDYCAATVSTNPT